MAVLSTEEINRRLGSLTGWRQDGKVIHKEFKFADFAGSVGFVNRVAERAEAANHHPDILIQYNRVQLILSTHSEGGLTGKDFDLAEQVDALEEG